MRITRRQRDWLPSEDLAQQVALSRIAQVFEFQLPGFMDLVGPIGVNVDLVHVGNNQQRRIVEGEGILPELRQSGVEVFALALILPAETLLTPHIGPALTAGGFGGPFFEGEPCTLGVSGCGVKDIKQAAEVIEMRLRG